MLSRARLRVSLASRRLLMTCLWQLRNLESLVCQANEGLWTRKPVNLAAQHLPEEALRRQRDDPQQTRRAKWQQREWRLKALQPHT